MTTSAAPAPTARTGAAVRSAPYRALVLAGAALAADVAFDPAHRHVPLCPMRALTGWWCPLCGGLRAADSLVHGQLAAALHYNLLFVAALPVLAVWWLDWTVRARAGRSHRVAPRAVGVAVVAVVVLFTVLRNLPFAHAALRTG
jgi:hypothetical protein